MQKYEDIERGQGLVVLVIFLIILTSVISTIMSYSIFTPEKYTDLLKSIMIIMQVPEGVVDELVSASEASLRRLDRRLYYQSQIYGGAVNLAIMLFLCVFLYLGRIWARCLITIILFLGVPGALLMSYVMFNMRVSITIGLFYITYGVIALIGGGILTFSSKVRAYAAYMRGA